MQIALHKHLCDTQKCSHLPNMPWNTSSCIFCVCVCVASLSMYPISHTHSSSARRAAVYSRPITHLSVKRLEFIRDTESRWQLPTDLTCVHIRRWSDPLGGYHHINKDIMSLERRKKNEQRHSKIHKKQPVGCTVSTERQVGENWGEYSAFLLCCRLLGINKTLAQKLSLMAG